MTRSSRGKCKYSDVSCRHQDSGSSWYGIFILILLSVAALGDATATSLNIPIGGVAVSPVALFLELGAAFIFVVWATKECGSMQAYLLIAALIVVGIAGVEIVARQTVVGITQ